MLEPEPHGSGWQVTLRPRGFARFFMVGFLGFWLCGWAMGEWFALGLIASSLESLFGPGFIPDFIQLGFDTHVSRGQASMVLAFILFWFALWTIGGMFALGQGLLLLAGREVVRWGPEALEVERRAFVLLSSARLDPTTLTGFVTSRGSLLARRGGRSVAVARLGTDEERAELSTRLETWRQAFGRHVRRSPEEPPAPGWSVTRDETGGYALTPSASARWLAAALLAFVASLFYLVLGFMLLDRRGTGAVIGLFVLGLPATAAAYGAVWLAVVRESWHPRARSLEIRRSAFGRTWSRMFSPLGLELRAHSDSDGDLHWTLTAHGDGKPHPLASAVHDSAEPDAIAAWLAERTGVEVDFTGRAEAERKRA